ncbi:MAG: hypothetical protein E7A72_07710 [Actinomyces urogenitalis]|uniref:hypothetical protein n=1 Tax=Actinomyces urogenitalis TaxID=103621 RepID=UPI0006603C69|nr:hypothetical protein [Actinomyces urogenitalis]MBS5976439.1 hypothetical protein [Actinomyces urogenitalis]MBS6072289.1 hypothetical protein [Actinomyces urogenitalis]MDU0864816.1 hypothetical protein [Actinomyces urogenitalis]MDU0875317.1 hypothetical protein [Actinomyces urogenitalis]MDU0972763.1 hypothetical protein [Actinomyces urogenitalis]
MDSGAVEASGSGDSSQGSAEGAGSPKGEAHSSKGSAQARGGAAAGRTGLARTGASTLLGVSALALVLGGIVLRRRRA